MVTQTSQILHRVFLLAQTTLFGAVIVLTQTQTCLVARKTVEMPGNDQGIGPNRVESTGIRDHRKNLK